jgi:hypothetical protein
MTKEERMFPLVKAQKSSGLGAHAYSESLGIKYATFQYLRKRYRDWQQAGLPGGHDTTSNCSRRTLIQAC